MACAFFVTVQRLQANKIKLISIGLIPKTLLLFLPLQFKIADNLEKQ